MLSIEITRLIAAAVAAFLLGYACYIAAYVKHKNEKRDTANRLALMAKSSKTSPEAVYDPSCAVKVDLEKTQTWYFGYRLALVGLIIVSTAVGWAVGWAVGQDYVLTWVEDAVLAAAGAIIGGFCLDKWIIHPIADGSFFEKVEDPIVQRFLQDGVPAIEDKVKEKRKLFRKKEKVEETAVPAAPIEVPDVPPVIVTGDITPEAANVLDVSHLTFDEKVKLLEMLKKSL